MHVAMLHGFHPVYDRAGGNPPFWTLAREEHFYVLYALLLASRRRWGVGVPIGIAFAVGIVVWRIALLIPDPSWQVLVETSAPALWIQWALGMLAVEAYWGRVRLPWWCASWPVALAWAAIAKASETWGLQLPPAALWGMVCFTVINAATRADAAGRWRGALAMRLSALGRMSYSLYLVHYPVRAVLKYGLRLDPAPDTFTYLANAALMVIAGCVAAAVFFVVIERRFLTHGAGAATGWTA